MSTAVVEDSGKKAYTASRIGRYISSRVKSLDRRRATLAPVAVAVTYDAAGAE